LKYNNLRKNNTKFQQTSVLKSTEKTHKENNNHPETSVLKSTEKTHNGNNNHPETTKQIDIDTHAFH